MEIPIFVAKQEWALKNIEFDVGQADAMLLLARNGDAVVIDTGRPGAHASLLLCKSLAMYDWYIKEH